MHVADLNKIVQDVRALGITEITFRLDDVDGTPEWVPVYHFAPWRGTDDHPVCGD